VISFDLLPFLFLPSFCRTIEGKQNIMDIKISIPAELESVLKERAARFGKDADDYLSEVVAHHLEKPSLDELLAPVREDFAKSGKSVLLPRSGI
jgi:hypothetical protein